MVDHLAEQAAVGPLDDTRYDDVLAFFGVNVNWSGAAVATGDPGIADVVRREARALDARDYEGWLALFSPGCVYWVPRNDEVGDPRLEPSVHFDDYRRLADRVALIRTGHLHAQTPPSRTSRVLSEVECRQATADLADVHSSLIVHEQRRGRSQVYAGRQFHRLERTGQGWQIRYRVLLLVDRDVSQGNTTFIL